MTSNLTDWTAVKKDAGSVAKGILVTLNQKGISTRYMAQMYLVHLILEFVACFEVEYQQEMLDGVLVPLNDARRRAINTSGQFRSDLVQTAMIEKIQSATKIEGIKEAPMDIDEIKFRLGVVMDELRRCSLALGADEE